MTLQPINKFMVSLRGQGVQIATDGERLRLKTTDGKLPQALRQELAARKTEIIAFLLAAQQSQAESTISPVSRDGSLPLSFAQQRIWILDQIGTGSAYNVSMAIRLQGQLDSGVVEQALNAIVARHEVLRTTFAIAETGEPEQTIRPGLTVPLPRIDLMHLSDEEQVTKLECLYAEEAFRPFDLTTDLMFRAKLIQLGDKAHVLIISIHHIATDGWSLGIFSRELATLYEAFFQGHPSPLPPLEIQYADFAFWQQNRRRDDEQERELTRQLNYWQQQLAGAPPLLHLPTDRPRPAVPSYRGGSIPFQLDRELTQELKRLSLQADATPFMTLLAAFQVLLMRYTGQEDIVVGSPIANRTRRELEPLFGVFVNTLALRTDLSDNPTFLDVLAQVRETAREAYVHQDLPFEQLVERLQPERSLNYNPLVQVLFIYQNTPQPSLTFGDLQGELLTFQAQPIHMDLEIEIHEQDNGLVGWWRYNSDLFDRTTIKRMVAHFQTLLAGIVAGSPLGAEQPIHQLPLLSDAEYQQIVYKWNDTRVDFGEPQTIHAIFEQQVQRTPDAIALAFGNEQLTYAELNARANQLAYYLVELLAENNSTSNIIAIAIERSIEMIVGILGVLKSGAAYLPIDMAYPPSRIQHMLQDSQASIVLTKSTLRNELVFDNIKQVHLDTIRLGEQPITNLSIGDNAGSAAYLIYTSGSTGTPKGVVMPHSALWNLFQWQKTQLPQPARTIQLSAISFDVACQELFTCWHSGGTLFLIQEEMRRDLPAVLAFIEQAGIERGFMPYVLLNALAEQATTSGLIPTSLRDIITAGEQLILTPAITNLMSQLPKAVLHNHYGPTETHVVTAYSLRSASEFGQPRVPIGCAIDNVKTYILNREQQPTPIGIAGELYIGGTQLAQSYLNQPELTAERFINHPEFGRLYKTGDLCRWLSEGNPSIGSAHCIEFLGRTDFQVKIRGFRIELGEIEATLTAHSAIRDAAVVVRESQSDDTDHEYLIGYLVANQVEAETVSESIDEWQTLWDKSYAHAPQPADVTFNIASWNSSYTGQPIPAKEMEEWVAETVADVRRLQPKRILEIGCGTGLLLARLAPDCLEYRATDYSVQAIQSVAQLKTTISGLEHIELDQRAADDFSGIAEGHYDCVILNSVIQYFPSVDYLLTVLAGAAQVVKPGGTIYVGDVRNLRLLQGYHTAVQIAQAADDVTLEQLHRQIQQRLRDEEELLIDPDFFHNLHHQLPQIARVEIQLKRGHFSNEMTQFRYQVVLHIAEKTARLPQPPTVVTKPMTWREVDWAREAWTLATLADQLHQHAQTQPTTGLLLRNIPNARVQEATQAAALMAQATSETAPQQTAAQLRTQLATQTKEVDPAALWALADTLPYTVQVTWSEAPDRMDACFMPRHTESDMANTERIVPPFVQSLSATKSLRIFANNPLLGRISRALLPEVRAWLQEKLPDYMIPTTFVWLDALPLTPNGKVDRRALPAPVHLGREQGDDFVPPETPTEVALADIWCTVLGIEGIGVHDNFFELGGHSLLATQVVSRIRQVLAIDLSLQTLFQNATVASLSAAVDASQHATAGQAMNAIPLADRTRALPLSHAQERLWFLEQLGGEGNSVYNIPNVLRLRGALNITALERSFQEIVQRHESLRTTFAITDGRPVQVIQPSTFKLPLLDLSGLTVTAQGAEIHRLAMAEVNHRFDLQQGPLFHATLVELGQHEGAEDGHLEPEYLLLINMHHSVSDGWSIEVFNRELAALYRAFSQEQPSPLAELTIQYADFALWQRAWLAEDTMSNQLAYWETRLRGAPPLLILPTDRPRPPIQSYKGAHYPFPLPAALAQQLQGLSTSAGTTLFMTLLAAFKVLLMRYSGQEDIVVGAPIANRNHLEIEPLIGFFANTLVLRNDLSGNPTFGELLAQVKSTTLDAYRHQDVPFEKVVEYLQPERNLSHSPLFQVMFDLLTSSFLTIDLPDLHVKRMEGNYPIAKFDLTLSILQDTVPDGENRLHCLFEYNTDLFDSATIERMATHFQTLLTAIAEEPEQPVRQLPMLAATEYQQIVHKWNDTAVDFGEPQTIHALFEQQVEHTPDAIALIYDLDDLGFTSDDAGGQNSHVNPNSKIPNRLTYQELNARANQLAHHLIELGVGNAPCCREPSGWAPPLGSGADTLVAVVMERSVEMVVSLLAVLKAGGVYVPIDPTYPQERIAFMLQDCGTALLLTESHLISSLPDVADVSTVIVDSHLQRYPSTNPITQTTAQDLAYVIYTSGSTGQPKGVMVEHGALMDHIQTTSQAYQITAADRILQFASSSFDVALEQIFLALGNGAGLVLRGNDVWTNEEFDRHVENQGITVADLPPAYLHQLVQHWQTTVPNFLNGQLRLMLVGGEKVAPETVNLWQQLPMQGARLLNAYGPTETTITATCFDLTDYRVSPMVPNLPIGQPLPNRRLYLLDEHQQPTPIGVLGELYIGGSQLARGYLNRPELTAERFIDHPEFGQLYKTGDLCRWLPDGNIEYIGRTDFQVKIRGFRIELGEIENALMAQEGVCEAVVLAQGENGTGALGARLVAYVVIEPRGRLVTKSDRHEVMNFDGADDMTTQHEDHATMRPKDQKTLRDALAQQLPDYMIPSAFVFLDAMPLTPNGKLDRRALPRAVSGTASGREYVEMQSRFVAPRNELEAEVAGIWQEVLHINQVGIYDNFFALGGHSLLATQVISQVRSQLNLDIPLKALFEASRLEDFAEVISQAEANTDGRIVRVSRDQPLPLSFAQQRLWFLDQLEPDSAFYNMPMVLRLTGQLDVAALEAAFRYLIARHESLRTIFTRESGTQRNNGEAMQIIHPVAWAAHFMLPVSLVTDEHEAQHLAQMEATTPFNLSEGPLLRVQLLQIATDDTARPEGTCSAQRHLLVLNMHHIISDGWSIGIFIQELTHAYRAYTAGHQPALPDLPIQYADFAVWQRAYLSGEILKTQLVYWREQLSGAPALLELPTDRQRPPVQSYRGAHYLFELDTDLTVKLNQLAQENEATLFMVLLTAFNVLLARYSRQDDIMVGTPIANRHRAEIEGLIGFFVNTLVLRTQMEENPTFTELLAQVRKTTLNAYQHQDLPFEQLVEGQDLERSLSYTPLFQVMLTLQNAEDGEVDLPDLTATMQPTNFPFAKFDLTLNLIEQGKAGGLLGMFEYATDLFDEATVARMASHFTVLLEGIVSGSPLGAEQPIHQLPILTEAEYHQIVHEWNDTTVDIAVDFAVDFGEPQTIHALFEQQVERTPDTIAIVIAEETKHETREMETDAPPLPLSPSPALSYRELNALANQLAHHLIALGVQAETLVAVTMERSVEMVVSLLAVLKAGGVYVPIDPTYPQERIAFMLQDCGTALLLTESHLISSLPDVAGVSIVIADSQFQRYPSINPNTQTTAQDLAYVIYTSGSTGQPKGVMVEHGALMDHIQTTSQQYQITAADRILQFASSSFDVALEQIFLALGNGAGLVLRGNDVWTNEEFDRHVENQGITVADLPPAYLHQLVQHWQTTVPNFLNGQLRLMLVGGEKVAPETVNLWQQLPMQGARLLNAYGPTETTITATCFDLTDYRVSPMVPNLPIGQPLPNRRLYLLDEHHQPTPIGVLGELYIGGSQLARGYLNRPELTTERFINHPEFGRLYKTGDLCRWLPDPDAHEQRECAPNLEYSGRTDFQVKIRGFRIELGEIENTLLAQEGISEAVVLVREDTLGARLVAYVVQGDKEARDGEINTPSWLRQNLAQRLPSYMVPAQFVLLDALPLLPNGKLDRAALSTLALSEPVTSGELFSPPATPTEEMLADIWAEVLGLEQIGRHDNFFALGGHSLLLTQLIFRIQERLHVDLALRDIFTMPTVAELATAIDTEQLGASYTESIDLTAETILDPTIMPTQAIGHLLENWQTPVLTTSSSILLTGATGFLGAFLLDELLQQTPAMIHCLVRCADQEAGMDRLQTTLQQYGLWQDAFAARIIPVPGDLAQPLLGLTADHFHALSAQVDLIYHNGALVDFIQPYQALKPANVLGTEEVLRLAAGDSPIPVHYVSTLSVFDDIDNFDGRSIDEESDLGKGHRLLGGYPQSKWVAEKLVQEAQRRGLPVTIYRPGLVSGDSQTGVWNTDDFFCRLLKGCIQLGARPQWENNYYLTPVDYVSRAIVALSLQVENQNRIFHLESPYPVQPHQLAESMAALGYSVREIPVDCWLDELKQAAQQSQPNVLTPLLPLLITEFIKPDEQGTADHNRGTQPPVFDCTKTISALAHTDIVCPPMDDAQLRIYFSYFIESGFLEVPSNQSAPLIKQVVAT